MNILFREYNPTTGKIVNIGKNINFGRTTGQVKVFDIFVINAAVQSMEISLKSSGNIPLAKYQGGDNTVIEGSFGVEVSDTLSEKSSLTTFFSGEGASVIVPVGSNGVSDFVYLSVDPGDAQPGSFKYVMKVHHGDFLLSSSSSSRSTSSSSSPSSSSTSSSSVSFSSSSSSSPSSSSPSSSSYSSSSYSSSSYSSSSASSSSISSSSSSSQAPADHLYVYVSTPGKDQWATIKPLAEAASFIIYGDFLSHDTQYGYYYGAPANLTWVRLEAHKVSGGVISAIDMDYYMYKGGNVDSLTYDLVVSQATPAVGGDLLGWDVFGSITPLNQDDHINRNVDISACLAFVDSTQDFWISAISKPHYDGDDPSTWPSTGSTGASVWMNIDGLNTS